MSVQLNHYLSFKDNGRQAMEFYHGIFGGSLDSTTFADGGMPHDPAEAGKLMHCQLTTDSGMQFMASDTPGNMEYRAPAGISMSLSGDDDATLSEYYEKLADGGAKTMPLATAPWGDKFGMVTDKFGVSWMVNITPAKQ